MKKKLVPPKEKLKGVQLPLLDNNEEMTPTQEAFKKAELKQIARNEEEKKAREPRVAVTAKGEAYFQQGDIRFPVDTKDLNKVVGSNGEDTPIDKLMDSEVAMLAQANNLPVSPFARELLRPVLIGVVQLAWYRAFEGGDSEHDWQHLEDNHNNRVKWYLHALSQYKEKDSSDVNEVSPRKKRIAIAKPDKWAKSYQIVAGKRAAASLSGRELQVFNVIAGLKTASTLAQIVEASKGKVDTKQDLTKIVHRFIGKLISGGALQEVKQ